MHSAIDGTAALITDPGGKIIELRPTGFDNSLSPEDIDLDIVSIEKLSECTAMANENEGVDSNALQTSTEVDCTAVAIVPPMTAIELSLSTMIAECEQYVAALKLVSLDPKSRALTSGRLAIKIKATATPEVLAAKGCKTVDELLTKAGIGNWKTVNQNMLVAHAIDNRGFPESIGVANARMALQPKFERYLDAVDEKWRLRGIDGRVIATDMAALPYRQLRGLLNHLAKDIKAIKAARKSGEGWVQITLDKLMAAWENELSGEQPTISEERLLADGSGSESTEG